MLTHKILVALGCALLLSLCGCSRQQSDWQKTRETNSPEAYEQFLKKYPSGEFTAQAQARVKELYEERDWQKARDADTPDAYQAFLKQYPEGKWTEEARIRLENFTLAQTPSGVGSAPGASGAPPAGAAPSSTPGAAPPAAASAPQTPKPRPTPPQPGPTPASKSGSYAVQLGAFKSGTAAANKRWEHLQKEYPKLFAGLSPTVVPKKTSSGTLYRLRAAGVSEKHARNICKNLKANSQPCMVLRPESV
jgi:cell division septation protein DedD